MKSPAVLFAQRILKHSNHNSNIHSLHDQKARSDSHRPFTAQPVTAPSRVERCRAAIVLLFRTGFDHSRSIYQMILGYRKLTGQEE